MKEHSDTLNADWTCIPRLETSGAGSHNSELYRSIVEGQPDLISCWHPDGTVFFVNRAFAAFYGRAEDDLLGRHFLKLLDPPERAIVAARILALSPDNRTQTGENWHTGADGERRYILWSDRVRYDEDGDPVEYLSVGRDITDRKVAEDTLRESQTLLSDIVNNAPIAISIKDLSHRFVMVNPEAEKLLGVSSAALLGETPATFSGNRLSGWEAAEQAVIKSGQSASWETQVKTPTGSRARRVTKFPIRGAAGGISHVGTISVELSDQRMTQANLHASEERYRLAVAAASDGIWDLNFENGVCYFSSRFKELLGYTDDEFGNTKEAFRALMHPDELADNIVAFEAATMPGNRPYEREFRLRTKARGFRLFYSKAYCSWDQNGKPTRFVGAIRDITDAKRLEAELKKASHRAMQASQAKTEFLAGMSHDLRTPLNAIIGFSEVIRDDLLGSPDLQRYRDYAADIHQSGSHLVSLINDILDLAKVEAKREELDEQPINVADLIGASIAMVKDLAAKDDVELVVVTDAAALPDIHADQQKLTRVLINILSNAVKFSRRGGRVVVTSSMSKSGGHVFQVIDRGIGIKPENIAGAMKPFEQIGDGNSGDHAGTGLGLPLAKAMTELHGGKFQIQSEYGVGTTVTLSFPPQRCIGR